MLQADKYTNKLIVGLKPTRLVGYPLAEANGNEFIFMRVDDC